MILQDNAILAWFINSIPWVLGFILVNLFFTFTVYIAAKILKLEDKSDYIEERNFFLRTFLLVLAVSVIVVVFQFLFVLMLFSPLFETIPIEILFAVLNTRLWDVVALLFTSGPVVLIMMIIIVVVIILIVSLAAMDAYGVSFTWAIATILVAIGVYLAIDLTVMFTINPDGVAGFINFLGNALRDLVWIAAFGELS